MKMENLNTDVKTNYIKSRIKEVEKQLSNCLDYLIRCNFFK
jgi:hypothetical protein